MNYETSVRSTQCLNSMYIHTCTCWYALVPSAQWSQTCKSITLAYYNQNNFERSILQHNYVHSLTTLLLKASSTLLHQNMGYVDNASYMGM